MNNDNEMSTFQFEEIERYLMHDMSLEEEAIFSARIASDPGLKEKTDEFKLILLAVKENKLQSQLSNFHQDVNKALPKPQETSIYKSKFLFAAASILVIIGFSIWLVTNSTREEQLYADYYKPDPGLVSAMGISENYAFDRGMIDYKMGDYDSAIKLWDSLIVLQGTNDTLSYYLGSALLGNDQAEKAIPYLKKIADSENVFTEDANWYLGLALLKMKKHKDALMYIRKSAQPEKEPLLNKLKNF